MINLHLYVERLEKETINDAIIRTREIIADTFRTFRYTLLEIGDNEDKENEIKAFINVDAPEESIYQAAGNLNFQLYRDIHRVRTDLWTVVWTNKNELHEQHGHEDYKIPEDARKQITKLLSCGVTFEDIRVFPPYTTVSASEFLERFSFLEKQPGEQMYHVSATMVVGTCIDIPAQSEAEATEKAHRLNEMSEGPLWPYDYNSDSFSVDYVTKAGPDEGSFPKESDWVEIVKHSSLPCSLNSFINSEDSVEYIVEIDGTTEYHLDFTVAMKDYIRRVLSFEKQHKVALVM